MKSKIVLFFLFFFILVDEAQSQSNAFDTTLSLNLKQILTKLDSLDSKLDSLDFRFGKFKNLKDCDKLKSENKKFADQLKENKELLAITQDSLNKSKSEFKKLQVSHNDLIKKSKSDSTNNAIKISELESLTKDLKDQKSNKDQQLNGIKNTVQNNINNSKKIDSEYLKTIKILFKDDKSSDTLILKIDAFIKNQKSMDAVDSMMRKYDFKDFTNVNSLLNSIKIDQTFKGQAKLCDALKSDSKYLALKLEGFLAKSKSFNSKYTDDVKYVYYFIRDIEESKNTSDVTKELFDKYPCMNYYVDMMSNRSYDKLPF